MRNQRDDDEDDRNSFTQMDDLHIAFKAIRSEHLPVHVERKYRLMDSPERKGYEATQEAFGDVVSALRVVISEKASASRY